MSVILSVIFEESELNGPFAAKSMKPRGIETEIGLETRGNFNPPPPFFIVSSLS